MKNFRFLLMAMFVALAFVSCGDDDESNNPDNGGNTGKIEKQIVGRWLLVTDEGYEIYDGMRDEWKEECAAYGLYIELRADKTLIVTDPEEGTQSASWMLEGSNLYIGAVGYFEYVGTVTGISSSKLVLEIHEKLDGDEFYNKLTFRRE